MRVCVRVRACVHLRVRVYVLRARFGGGGDFLCCRFGGGKSCGATPKTGVAWSRLTQNHTEKQTNMRTLTN